MLKRVFAILLTIVILVVLVGFMLPRQVTIERSIQIDQPAEVIFEVLSDFRHFSQWSPWHQRSPDAGYRIEGPDSGVGSTLIWSDEDGSGAGRLWIVDVERPRRIDMQMELGDSEVDTYFGLEPDGFGQRVTWGMVMEFGTFDLTGRYVGLMMPGLIGRSYREGLERLEEYLDHSPGQVPSLPDERHDAIPVR
ncbi:MAG: SRPBCC family protein [Wenzhouxiangella sp.]